MMGNVFDIQRFSIHDGPGIRVTIFLKGCSLRCKWCHNPEGQNSGKSLRFIPNLCINCQKCKACPQGVHSFIDNIHHIDFSKCKGCSLCVNSCPANALILYGKEMSPKEVADEVLKDKDYITNGGGITFSGGEPLLQSNFIIECVNETRKDIPNLHVCIDTAGLIPYENIKKLLHIANIFLFDIKAISEDKHILGTGYSNKTILENLHKLDKENKDIWIRVPIIPGINDSNDELELIADEINSLKNVKRVTLIPYHSLGHTKYDEMGMEYHYDYHLSIPEERLEEIKKLFALKGITHQS